MKPEFFDPPYNILISKVNDYYTKYHSIPKFHIIEAETGIKLEDRKTIDKSELEYISDTVLAHCKIKGFVKAVMESMDLINIGDTISIETKLREAMAISINKDIGTDQFLNPRLRLEAMQENLDIRSIGWKNIDEMMDFIKRGEFYLFAAGSGVGKSVTLANIAHNLSLQGLNCLYISLELSENLVSKRLDSIFSGISTKEVFSKIDELEEFYINNKNNYGSVITKRMHSETRPAEIRNIIFEYHLHMGIYPDVLLIDYLDIMSPNDIRKNAGIFDIDKVKSEQLRDIFIDYNMYGFTASQLNRDSWNVKEKSQAHIAGGLSKINTSDVTIAISLSDENIDIGELVFEPLKLRNSSIDLEQKMLLYRDSKTLRISEECPKVSDFKTNNMKSPTVNKLNEILQGMKK